MNLSKGRSSIHGGLVTALAAGAVAAASPAVAGAAQVGAAASKGNVSLLYAGSLVKYMEDDFGPSFQRVTGYPFTGYGGGSNELAAEIKGGVRSGDVFISASSSVDRELEGSANGNWVSWYTTFATSPLELAYDPETSFGKELARGVPWYQVVTKPGILVGRTDPKLDPKGKLTVEAVAAAARKLHDPALETALEAFPVYPETSLVGHLQSGQLDAGFFYAIEAHAAGLKTVPITPAYKYAEYTVTILNHDPNPVGAAALVRYLLNVQRTYTLQKNGINPYRKPSFSGKISAVPVSLRKLVGATR